ncbi:hypothetical protein BBJ28_00008579 [Nothophytophthora sp. Chile5]|nr:hypothetical protein BBJ28_00008579 [Nothophytophthora sp. Chile5]
MEVASSSTALAVDATAASQQQHDNQQQESGGASPTDVDASGKNKKKKKKKKKNRRKSLERTQSEVEAMQAEAEAESKRAAMEKPEDDEEEEEFVNTVTMEDVDYNARAESNTKQEVQEESNQTEDDVTVSVTLESDSVTDDVTKEEAAEVEEVATSGDDASSGAVDEKEQTAAEVPGQSDNKDNQQEEQQEPEPSVSNASSGEDEHASSSEKLPEQQVVDTSHPVEPLSESPPSSTDSKKATSTRVGSLFSRFTSKVGRKKLPSRTESAAKLDLVTPSPVKTAVSRLELHEEHSLDDLPMRTKRDFFGDGNEQSVHVSAEKQKYDAMEQQRKLEEEAAAAARALTATKRSPPSSTKSSEEAAQTETTGTETASESATVSVSESSGNEVAGTAIAETTTNSSSEVVASLESAPTVEEIAPLNEEASVDATSATMIVDSSSALPMVEAAVNSADSIEEAQGAVELETSRDTETTTSLLSDDVVETTESDAKAVALEAVATTETETVTSAASELAIEASESDEERLKETANAKEPVTLSTPGRVVKTTMSSEEQATETTASPTETAPEAAMVPISKPVVEVSESSEEAQLESTVDVIEPLIATVTPPTSEPPVGVTEQVRSEKMSPVRSIASRFEGKREQSLDSLKFRTVREFFPEERSIRVGAEKQKYETLTEQQNLKAKAEEEAKAKYKTTPTFQMSKSPVKVLAAAISPQRDFTSTSAVEEVKTTLDETETSTETAMDVAIGDAAAISSADEVIAVKNVAVMDELVSSPTGASQDVEKIDAERVTPVKSIASRFEGKREQSLDSLKFRTVREFFPEERSVRVGSEKQKFEAQAQQHDQSLDNLKFRTVREFFPTGDARSIHVGAEKAKYEALSKQQQKDAKAAEELKSKRSVASPVSVKGKLEHSGDSTSNTGSKDEIVQTPAGDSTVSEGTPPVVVSEIAAPVETIETSAHAAAKIDVPSIVDAVAATTVEKSAPTPGVADAPFIGNASEVTTTEVDAVEVPISAVGDSADINESPMNGSAEHIEEIQVASEETQPGSENNALEATKLSTGRFDDDNGHKQDNEDHPIEESNEQATRRTDSRTRPMLTTERSFVMEDDHTIETEDTVVVRERPLTDGEEDLEPVTITRARTARQSVSASTPPKARNGSSARRTSASAAGKKSSVKSASPGAATSPAPQLTRKVSAGSTGFIKPPPAPTTVPVPMKRASITAPTASYMAKQAAEAEAHKVSPPPKRHDSASKQKGTVGPTGFIKPPPAPATVPVPMKRASITAPTASWQARNGPDHPEEVKVLHPAPTHQASKPRGTVGPTGFIKPLPPPPTVPVAPKRASIMAPTASYLAKKAAEHAEEAQAASASVPKPTARNKRYSNVQSKVLEGIQSGSTHATTKKTMTKEEFIAAERRKSLGSAGVRDVLLSAVDRRSSLAGRSSLDTPQEPFVRSTVAKKKHDRTIPRYLDYENSPAYARLAQEQHERRRRLEEENSLKSEKRRKELRVFFTEQQQKALSSSVEEVRRGQELHEFAELTQRTEIEAKKAIRKEKRQARAQQVHDQASASSSSGRSLSSNGAPRASKKTSVSSSTEVKMEAPLAAVAASVGEQVTTLDTAAPSDEADAETTIAVTEEASGEVAQAEATVALTNVVVDDDPTLEHVAKKINFDEASSDSDEKGALDEEA